jgi:hypothetical protein
MFSSWTFSQVWPVHQEWFQYRFSHSIKDGIITIQAAHYNQYRSFHSIYDGFYYQPAIISTMGFNTGSATQSRTEHQLAWLAHVTWDIVNLASGSKMG